MIAVDSFSSFVTKTPNNQIIRWPSQCNFIFYVTPLMAILWHKNSYLVDSVHNYLPPTYTHTNNYTIVLVRIHLWWPLIVQNHSMFFIAFNRPFQTDNHAII